jgi:hypothetical protein
MHMHVLHEVHGRASLTTTTVYVQAKREAVELATLEWVSWFDHHCLLKPLGYTSPTETEVNYYMQLSSQVIPG